MTDKEDKADEIDHHYVKKIAELQEYKRKLEFTIPLTKPHARRELENELEITRRNIALLASDWEDEIELLSKRRFPQGKGKYYRTK